MEDDDEEGTDNASKSGNDERHFEIRSLESAENHVAGSAGTGPPGDGCSKAFTNAFDALLDWAQNCSLIRLESDFVFLARTPDGKGNEHEAWFDEASNRWFKATYPNRFGVAWSNRETATPREYLTRLVLANKYFADDVRLIALVNCGKRMRVLTSQPHIAGEPATYEEIKQWFIDFDFISLESGERVAWYRLQDNLLVADAHEGNIIKTNIGVLVPIDLNIIQPEGEFLSKVLHSIVGL